MSLRTLIVFAATTLGLAAQTTYFLPQMADGVAPNGATCWTTLVVVNSGKTAANLNITGSRDDGSSPTLSIPGLGASTKLSIKLAPGATRLMTTDGSGDGSLTAGLLTSDVAIGVSAVVSSIDSGGNVVAETSAPVISSDELATSYTLPVDTTGVLNTAVAFYNPSAAPATIAIALVDASGQAAGSATVTLGPRNHATRFIKGDLFPGVADFQGSLSVGGKVAVAGMRQLGGGPAFTLVPAVSQLSHRVRFLFPQVFDGPAPEGTLQTTFVLTNLSTVNAATPSLSLTLDDGMAMPLNVNGLTAGQTIPPGGTVFWQTDGSSASLASGAAVIQSDQPLAVTALLTNSLVESAMAPSTSNYQFRIPFDQASGVTAGLAILNSGARAFTPVFTLLDADGATVTTTQGSPLAGFGKLSAGVQDLFPGASTSSGSIVVSTATPVDLSLAAYSLRQSGARLLSPALRITSAPGTPTTVTPTLDASHSVSADISTAGGSLNVTDAKGNKFTLTIPQGALLDHETIKMTAITSAKGLSTFTAGVQMEPDGLGLLNPAQLKIELASTQPAGTYPIGWRGASPGVYLNPPLKDTKSLTLVLTHFSGAGVGGLDLTSELINIANQLDLVNSAAAYWANQARSDALSGNDADSEIDGAKLLETLDIGLDTVLVPMMELAVASDDEDVMRCAVGLALAAVRQLELLGLGDDAHATAAQEFIAYCFQRWASKVKGRCDKHDFTAFYDALGVLRQAALTGQTVDIDPSGCPPVVELDYTSEMKGDIPVGVTGNYDATISGKVILPGNFTKDMLTQVTDPAKDLLTSFTLTGSAPESYDSITFTVNNVPAGCSETISAKTPATMTVKAGQDPQLSQVQFKFNPHYDPQAVTANGVQLCSFCPVYRKVPLKVGVWMDPGKPSETLLSTCPGGSMSLVMYNWWTAWVTNHAAAGDNGYIESWDLVDTPSVFAQKTISKAITGPGGITLTEKTDLKLKPVTGK